MSHQTIGTDGFVAWFFSIIYMRIVRACKNIFVRILVHSIGLIITIFGLCAFLTSILSPMSIYGLFLIFGGIVIFVIPFGINAEL